MSGLIKILGALAPAPPASPSLNYDGLEYRWKMFTFRPAMFKMEGILLGVIGAYLAFYFIGKYLSESRASSALKPFSAMYEGQFSKNNPVLSSGPALHLLYSTGRRNVLCLHTTLTLTPIHDIVALLMHFGKSIIEPTFDSSETLLFNFTLGRGDAGLQGDGLGVWGLVDKTTMRETRDKRWDLSFPRMHETSTVPISHALFTEHSDVTDLLIKTPNIGITDVLSNPKAASVLKYLIVTDQPAKRPAKGALPAKFKTREIALAVYKPRNAQQVEAVKAWLQVAFNIADLLGKPNLLKPEVTRKLVKTRQQTDADLGASYAKEKAEDEPPAETAEERRLAKKKAERAQMSEKELKRLDELEKKREMRKMAKRGQLGQQ